MVVHVCQRGGNEEQMIDQVGSGHLMHTDGERHTEILLQMRIGSNRRERLGRGHPLFEQSRPSPAMLLWWTSTPEPVAATA
jgi:hypothetical protein